MKKVISVSLSVLFIAAMLHLSVATHYCDGKVTGSKVSISGKLASCGMEGEGSNLPLSGLHFVSHCCDNVLVFCGINSTFFPAVSFVEESFQLCFHIFSVPVDLALNSPAPLKSSYTNVSPPGASASSSVDLSDICILRI
jgi:hypothetical protein